ncbi:MAG: nitronate monooxygenase [Pseudomonadota bacterium]
MAKPIEFGLMELKSRQRGARMNELMRRLELRWPIFQAPMAGVSTPELAAAVSNAGGLGALGLGAATVDGARQQVAAARALTLGPLHLNFFCHPPATRDTAVERAWIERFEEDFQSLGAPAPAALQEVYPSFIASGDSLALIEATRPEAVSFHFGLPEADAVRTIRSLECLTLVTVTSVAEAHAAVNAGVDGLIAQGIEAGGHRGNFDVAGEDKEMTTAELVPALLASTELPIVAAGGIMDGTDLRGMLDLGAAAVQLGTAFVLCPEAATNADYRSRLRAADADDTLLTAAISGRRARGIRNRLVEVSEKYPELAVPAYPVAYDLAKQLNSAALAKGATGYGAYWAGTGVARARERPAAAIVAALAEEAGLKESA